MKWATYIRVKPIEWILDDENKMLISRYKIVSLPLNKNSKKVLNSVFAKDIVPSGIKVLGHKITEIIGNEESKEGRHR